MKKTIFLSTMSTLFLSTLFFVGISQAAHVNQDGETLAFVMTVDENEIALASEVLKGKISPAVKKYAKMLKKEHTSNLMQATRLSEKTGIRPLDTAMIKTQKKQGKQELDKLSSLQSPKLEKAYINAMVKGHKKVLKTIDQRLKNVSNPDLKGFLLRTRPHIAYHLQQAQMLQASMH